MSDSSEIPPRLRLEGCDVDLERMVVIREGEVTALRPRESELLAYLVRRVGRAVSKAELQEQVWGYAASVRSRTVISTVHRLRQKIEADPKQPRHLIAVPGGGYRFEWVDPTPAAPPVAEAPGNLLVPEHALLGRASVLSAALDALSAHSVVTLVGPAGVGKSRLALELARAHGSAYRGGAWRVPLEESDDVAQAVARTLGVRVETRDLVDAVGTALAHRGPVLLWLDGCEGRVQAVRSVLAAWLDAAPLARVLATSRRPLGVGVPIDVPVLPRDDARALLLQRARALRTTFGRDPEVVDALVGALDGLPLALELAAGRAGVLDAATLLDKLRSGAPVLARPGATGPHRSLAVALDSSWQLLDEVERSALSQATVFVDGFTAEAAEAVIELGETWPLDALERLRRGSWLVSEALPEGTRFRLLDSVRSAVRDALQPGSSALERHAAYYARLGVDPPLIGSNTVSEDDTRELPNVLAALDRTDDPVLRARLLVAATRLPGRHSRLDRLGDHAEAVEPSALAHEDATCVLLAQAHLRLIGRGHAAAVQKIERALERARVTADPGLEAAASVSAGEMVAFHLGDRDRALQIYERGLSRSRAAGDPVLTVRNLLGLATIHLSANELDRAEPLLLEACALVREDDPVGRVRAEALLGATWDRQGRLDAAATLQHQAIERGRRAGVAGPLEYALLMAMHTEHSRGRPEAADGLLVELIDHAERRGATSLAWRYKGERAGVLQLLGRADEAEALGRLVLGRALARDSRLDELQARHHLGQLALHTGSLDESETQLAAALDLAERLQDPMHRAVCRAQLSLLCWSRGGPPDPEPLRLAAELLDGHIESIELRAQLSGALAALDRIDEARVELNTARDRVGPRCGQAPLLALWAGHLDLALARDAARRGEARLAERWRKSASDRMVAPLEPALSHRFARRVLRMMLDA